MKLFWPKTESKKAIEELTINSEVHIEPTLQSPEIHCYESGEIDIKGRIILEDCSKFFRQLFLWLEEFKGNRIHISLRIDYLNTTATEWLFKFFHEIEQSSHIFNIVIHWFIEDDDEDFYESVKMLEHILERSEVRYTII